MLFGLLMIVFEWEVSQHAHFISRTIDLQFLPMTHVCRFSACDIDGSLISSAIGCIRPQISRSLPVSVARNFHPIGKFLKFFLILSNK